jgi:hypothetical protein
MRDDTGICSVTQGERGCLIAQANSYNKKGDPKPVFPCQPGLSKEKTPFSPFFASDKDKQYVFGNR